MKELELLAKTYLASFFNKNINESFDDITEEDLIDAISHINLISFALTEQFMIPTNPSTGREGFTNDIEKLQQFTSLLADRFKGIKSKFDAAMQKAKDVLTPEQIKNRGKVAQLQAATARVSEPRLEFDRDQPKFLSKSEAESITDAGRPARLARDRAMVASGDMTPEQSAENYLRELIARMRKKGVTGMFDETGLSIGSRGQAGKSGFYGGKDGGLRQSTPTDIEQPLTKKQEEKIREREIRDAKWERDELPALASSMSDALHKQNMADYEKKFGKNVSASTRAQNALDLMNKPAGYFGKAGRGTLAGERKIDQILSKPSDQPRAEAARQSAIASRKRMADQDKAAGLDTAAGDPDTFKFYQDGGIKPTGKTDSGEPAYTLDDRLKYQVQKRTRELRGGRFSTRVGSNLYVEQYTGPASGPTGRINVIDMGAERESGQRMRGPSRSGYPSRFPGSMVGPASRPVSQERLDAMQERLDAMDARFDRAYDVRRIETPEETLARVQARNEPGRAERMAASDARRQARADYEASPAGQAAANRAIDAENQSRATRGLPPLNATAARRLGRRVIASDVARGVADASRRAAANNQPPPTQADREEIPYFLQRRPGTDVASDMETTGAYDQETLDKIRAGQTGRTQQPVQQQTQQQPEEEGPSPTGYNPNTGQLEPQANAGQTAFNNAMRRIKPGGFRTLGTNGFVA